MSTGLRLFSKSFRSTTSHRLESYSGRSTSVSELPGDAKSDEHKRNELQAARGFRVLLNTQRLNRRAYALAWGGLHLIKGFDRDYVQDAQDRWYPVKDVLPTNAPEHEIPATALRPGDAQVIDDEIVDDSRTVGPSVDGASPSIARGGPKLAAPVAPPPPRRQLGQTEDAASVLGDLHSFNLPLISLRLASIPPSLWVSHGFLCLTTDFSVSRFLLLSIASSASATVRIGPSSFVGWASRFDIRVAKL